MNGLIVAGVAGIAGIAGVVGLSEATVDTPSGAPAPALVSTASAGSAAPGVLEQRLARLREAERAADAALRRSDAKASSVAASSAPAARVSVAAPVAAAVSYDDHASDDDGGHEGYDDHGADDGEHHEQDD